MTKYKDLSKDIIKAYEQELNSNNISDNSITGLTFIV